MKSIEFKKRRGIIIDMLNVMSLYTRSSSLDAIYKHYKIKIDPDICASYAVLYQFMDEHVKELKPFFKISPYALSEGSIMYKLLHRKIAQEHVFLEDIVDFLNKIKWDGFVAELFRLTDDMPESARPTYMNIVHNRDSLEEFLERQNYTYREKRAIRRFINYPDYSYEQFILFIKKLYTLVELEHKKHDRKLTQYFSWVQSQFNRNMENFIFSSPDTFGFLKSNGSDMMFIITTGLFPPYSVQVIKNNKVAVAHFGYGARTEYARERTIMNNRINTGYSRTREEVIRMLKIEPMRLCDLASSIDTSSADISYHISVLENNGYIKRVRINNCECFALNENQSELTK